MVKNVMVNAQSLKRKNMQAFLAKGVRSHAHASVHASQHWEVRLIVRLFIKNQLLFTIAPGISSHGVEQWTSVTQFDEQNME